MPSLPNVFKALSDETRLQMLDLLFSESELCVCDFVKVLGISQSKASRHLRLLVNAGLLKDRREAVWVHFRINDEPDPAQARLIDILPEVLDGQTPPDLPLRLSNWRKAKALAGGPFAEDELEDEAAGGAKK